MLINDTFFYTLADRRYYEPVDRIAFARDEFMAILEDGLPDMWSVERKGVWLHCRPTDVRLPSQGWKIHVSATLSNASQILSVVAAELRTRRIGFKCALDKRTLSIMNGKRWPRGGSGKFITIYPVDTPAFVELLDRLYPLLAPYVGPFVLSDRRYKDSQVLYYRYGGIIAERVLTIEGTSTPVVRTSDGTIVPDVRAPFFAIPDGVTDPIAPDVPAGVRQRQPIHVGAGRYRIQSAISFSNTGGVYVAVDLARDRRVIIKEARPCTNSDAAGGDAVGLLMKEHRLLMTLDGLRCTPAPFDMFKEAEHWFLVEEYLDGPVLRSYMTAHALGLLTRPSRDDIHDFYRLFKRVYAAIARKLDGLHSRGIVIGDMSHYNIIVLDIDEPRFIDLEGASQCGVDVPTTMYTPGFAPHEVVHGRGSTIQDDCFGLGSLMFAGLAPLNNAAALDGTFYARFLDAWRSDFGLPVSVDGTICRLLGDEAHKRPSPRQVADVLSASDDVPDETRPFDTSALTTPQIEAWLSSIVQSIVRTATYDRTDRLFPADVAVFETNPLGIAYGACGVAYVIKQIAGELPDRMLQWILDRPCDAQVCPPGLYVGMGGIAWALYDVGAIASALSVARASAEHPLRFDSPDLFFGLAGWGLAQLKFFVATGDQYFLDKALEAGVALLQSRESRGDGYWWSSAGSVCCGIAHGASGISLFLLYLYAVTGREAFLDAGRRGIAFVLSRSIVTRDGALTWRAKEAEPTYTPYWRWGSAGIGAVLLRYEAMLGERYDAIDGIMHDIDRKYTIFPGYMFGLAGLGDFAMDCLSFGRCATEANRIARKVISGIIVFGVDTPDGLAFPGETLMRLSADYGTGSAGMAMLMRRYVARAGAAFVLDDVLTQRGIRREAPYNGGV